MNSRATLKEAISTGVPETPFFFVASGKTTNNRIVNATFYFHSRPKTGKGSERLMNDCFPVAYVSNRISCFDNITRAYTIIYMYYIVGKRFFFNPLARFSSRAFGFFPLQTPFPSSSRSADTTTHISRAGYCEFIFRAVSLDGGGRKKVFRTDRKQKTTTTTTVRTREITTNNEISPGRVPNCRSSSGRG